MSFIPTIKCDNCRSNGCAAVGVRFGRVRKMNSNGNGAVLVFTAICILAFEGLKVL
jgi:hypothetical protein